MARIDVNLNSVPEPEPHPTGEALLRVEGTEIKENKEKDGSYINLKLKVVGSENKSPVWHMLSLKPEALWNLKAFYLVAVMGKPRSEAKQTEFDPTGLDTDEFLGKEFYDELQTEEYPKGSGNFKNKLAGKYKPAGV